MTMRRTVITIPARITIIATTVPITIQAERELFYANIHTHNNIIILTQAHTCTRMTFKLVDRH